MHHIWLLLELFINKRRFNLVLCNYIADGGSRSDCGHLDGRDGNDSGLDEGAGHHTSGQGPGSALRAETPVSVHQGRDWFASDLCVEDLDFLCDSRAT